ncbi:hypothetical protein MRX96_036220 [Rhipicephalus microplus]
MEAKSTVKYYRTHKKNISGLRFYDYSCGSSLLFEARAGTLRTVEYAAEGSMTLSSGACEESTVWRQGHKNTSFFAAGDFPLPRWRAQPSHRRYGFSMRGQQ